MIIWLWVGFVALVLAVLALDLGLFHRRARVVGIREALGWTVVWIVFSLAFNVGVYFIYRHRVFGIVPETTALESATDFLTGYVVEKSLSMDNIFVISMIFAYFRVPGQFQHRTLYWGILGALVMRGGMILGGAALIDRFHWMIYVFGGLLLVTALKMLFSKDDSIDPDQNPLVRLARRIYPVSPDFDGERFFTRIDGRRVMTPLFLVLLVVESSDVVFAIDSIPAIFAFTTDPFIVFTSNVCAILGLRALYFALAALMRTFRYLKPALIVLLIFVAAKMLASHAVKLNAWISLGIIVGILTIGIIASRVIRPKPPAPE